MVYQFSSPPLRVADTHCATGRFQLAPSTALFHQGDTQGVWRLTSGAIRLVQRSSGQSVLVSVAVPGDLVGYETLLEGPHSFDAITLVASTLIPLEPAGEAHRKALIVEALLQQPPRSHAMAIMRTGPVTARVTAALRLLGYWPPSGWPQAQSINADVLRQSLPPLKDIADLVDAKVETVCRVLAQLLPPRTRKTGPKNWAQTAQDVATRALGGVGGFTSPVVEVAA